MGRCRVPNALWEVNELLTAIVRKLGNPGHGCWNYPSGPLRMPRRSRLSVSSKQIISHHFCHNNDVISEMFSRWCTQLSEHIRALVFNASRFLEGELQSYCLICEIPTPWCFSKKIAILNLSTEETFHDWREHWSSKKTPTKEALTHGNLYHALARLTS